MGISGDNPNLCFFGNTLDPNRSPSACDFDQGADPVVLPNGTIWERRKKLLAYAFITWLLTQPGELVAANAQDGCHRTGQRSRLTASPLYRLHAAIAYLWTACFPVPLALSPP